MTKTPLALFLVSLLCLAGGCVRSVQPILQDNQLVAGDPWLGYWITEDKELITINPKNGNDKTYNAVYIDKDGKIGTFDVRFGKVGDLTIAESHPTDPRADASDGYKLHLLPLYSFAVLGQAANGDVTLRLMDPKWLKTYLEAHPRELAYIMPDGDDPLFTAPTADLQAFLLKHAYDEGAFGTPARLHRVPVPTQPSTK
jgi:hypothetical protein